MSDIERAALEARQREEWEDSVFIENSQASAALVLHRPAHYTADRANRAVNMYLQAYPSGVFYFAGEDQCYMGFRYGLEGQDYVSF